MMMVWPGVRAVLHAWHSCAWYYKDDGNTSQAVVGAPSLVLPLPCVVVIVVVVRRRCCWSLLLLLVDRWRLSGGRWWVSCVVLYCARGGGLRSLAQEFKTEFAKEDLVGLCKQMGVFSDAVRPSMVDQDN
jgi:hypothetical protein